MTDFESARCAEPPGSKFRRRQCWLRRVLYSLAAISLGLSVQSTVAQGLPPLELGLPVLPKEPQSDTPLQIIPPNQLRAVAQNNSALPAPRDNGNPRPGYIRLNLEGNITLEALIELVEKRLGWNFIYASEIGERQINIKAPNEIPADALPALLSSVLRMENLALTDADVPGWKRIVDAGAMLNIAKPGDPREILERDGAATPVTRAFVVKHMDVEKVATIIRPFLTKSGPGAPDGTKAGAGSNILPVPNGKTIVVTDFAPVVLTVERLIELLDQPPGEASYEVYSVQNMPSGKLVEQVKGMLGINAEGASPSGVGLVDESRTNQIVVIGPQTSVDRALQLLQRFDVSLGLTTIVYRLQYVKAERIDRLVQGFISPRDAERVYQSTIDKEGNLLVVRTTAEIHARIEELKGQIDIPVRGEESPIRFYKLKNANATDVLYTLLALQEVAGTGGVLGFNTSPNLSGNATSATSATPNPDGTTPLSININSAQQAQPRGFAPYASLGALGGSPFAGYGGYGGPGGAAGFGGYGQSPFGNQSVRLPFSPLNNNTASYGNIQQFGQDRRSAILAPQLATGGAATLPGGARVSADITTNSLVIVARTEIQELYGKLIESLDVRRPQVIIEAKIVAIDTSGQFSLGVEISGGDRTGDKRLFSFTSFGLSQIDPTTGALSIAPSIGFNGALVDPDVADVIVRALSTHNRVNVLASPRILVNDNATGQLESVTSVPFQSVNASDTVATTSLGGDQQAGTTITVTPRIKEDDHLQMEFSLEFSTFGEGGSATLPPPRQIDRVGSAVTIPNGHTVIVGGLKRTDETNGRSGVPFAEAIPILRELTSLTTKNSSTTSFFVFLRPVILRDERFDDLKFISQMSAQDAGLPAEYPISQPVMME